MKWIYIALTASALSSTQVFAAPVYKCTTSDGRTIFSSAGCGTENGEFEAPDLKINEVGRVAEPYEVQRLRQERAAAAARGLPVDVIRDSAKRDSSSRIGDLNRRNDIVEDNLDRYRMPPKDGVNVIRDSGRETPQQRARRLRTDALEIQAQ